VHGIVKANGHVERAELERLARLAATVLDSGRPFALEGWCRHILRVRFIHDGEPWAVADRLAETVVRRALDIIGARRPSWYEGQPEFTRTRGSGRLYCQNPECGKPIERVSTQNHLAYCSEACRLEAKTRRHYSEHRTDRVASAQARRDRRRAQAKPRVCARCGNTFQPLDVTGQPRQRFCGRFCGRRFASPGVIAACSLASTR
jgi:hypothetical protein